MIFHLSASLQNVYITNFLLILFELYNFILGGSVVKNPPAMQETCAETWIRSLGWEDPLEKEMATHSNILAWTIPWREEPGRLQYMQSQRVGHNWVTNIHTHTSFVSSTSFVSFIVSLSKGYHFIIWTQLVSWFQTKVCIYVCICQVCSWIT